MKWFDRLLTRWLQSRRWDVYRPIRLPHGAVMRRLPGELYIDLGHADVEGWKKYEAGLTERPTNGTA